MTSLRDRLREIEDALTRGCELLRGPDMPQDAGVAWCLLDPLAGEIAALIRDLDAHRAPAAAMDLLDAAMASQREEREKDPQPQQRGREGA